MKQIFTRILFLVILTVSFANTGFAQTVAITGKVSSSDRIPIPGVSIVVKNGAVIGITDDKGNFNINVSVPTTLIIRSTGFIPQQVVVKDQSPLNIILTDDITALDEIVVSGLASGTKRSNLANSVTSISSKELVGTTPPQTLDKALYGKVPGANIRANSGAPGGGISVQLRGISSLQGASQPLYIIDGVYLNNNTLRTGRSTLTGAGGSGEDDAANRVADLNPDDIENIEVLKGSSASAIYGTRANAGVIIITTKKGKAGKTKISFSQDLGFSTIARYVGSAPWNEEKIKTFFPAATQAKELERYKNAVANNDVTDFEKLVYGETPFLYNSNLSLSGGTEKTKFYVSGNLSKEGGIIKNTGFERRSIRLNLDHKINNWIDLSINSNYLNTDSDRGFTGNQNNSGTSIGYILGYTPNYYNPRPVNGVYPDNPYSSNQNPLELRDRSINNAQINRFIQAANLNLYFLRTGTATLKFAAQGGIDYLTSNSKQYLPDDLQAQKSLANPGDLVIGRENARNLNLQGFLIYNQQVNRVNFTTQVGGVFLQTQSNALLNRGRGLVSGQQNISQAAVQSVLQHYDQKVRDFGLVAQEELNFEDKVIATVGVRFDKSTLNGNSNKFYAFPKASTAVNLTKFDFWNVGAISQLKLRTAYGQTGGLASFGDTFTSLSPVITGGIVGSVVSSTVGNPDIKPERAGELEFGTDIGFFKNRIVLEATYYNKKVSDLIQNLTLAGSSGNSIKKVNAADLTNKGVELALTAIPISNKDITWTTRILYWSNRSKLTKLKVPSYTSGIYGTSYGTYLFKEGYSPTTIVGTPQITPGNFTVYGDSQADFQSSWYNSVSFLNGFTFSTLLDWRKGGKIMNITLYNTDNGGTTPDWNDKNNPDGVANGVYRRGKANAGTYIQDGGYLKLREAALNYSLPKALTQRLFKNRVEQVKLGFSATNLFIITKYKGYDPEVSSFGTSATNTGSDLFNYPSSKRFLFNLRLDF